MSRGKRHQLFVAAAKASGVYEQLVEARGVEECFGCGRPRGAGKRRLSIDHDHARMFVRGLLCFRCNRILEDSVTPELLRGLAEYLEDAGRRYEEMIAGKSTGGAGKGQNEAAASRDGLGFSHQPATAGEEGA